MSHPDPNYDYETSYVDDIVYDDYNDFYDEDSSHCHPDAEHETATHFDDAEEDDVWDDSYDDSMDGDFDSAMRDAGFGTDEDYGYYGEDF